MKKAIKLLTEDEIEKEEVLVEFSVHELKEAFERQVQII